MSRRRILKLIHLVGTVWFILCVGCVIVLELRQAGLRWWVIFSLSGHSGVLVFLLVSLYLFAIFRGVDRSQNFEVEHPLTSTSYYAVFYGVTPFLGGLAGCLAMTGVATLGQFLLGIAMGTLGATFVVWVILDPLAGFVEMLPPASRKHRTERLAKLRALRQKREQERKQLLANILAQEDLNRRNWQRVLQPYAEKLAESLASEEVDLDQAEQEAVDIGVSAWRIGGLGCMRQLRDMVIELCRQNKRGAYFIDYISYWWDGIGNWRGPSFS